MKSIVLKASAVALAVGIAALALAGTARAAHVRVELSAPDQAAIGRPMEVQAHFHSVSDEALTDIAVTFHEEVTFGGVTSDVELGRAVTDKNGFAALTYEPRTAGTHEIHVRYAYGGGQEEDAATSLTVPATGQQLYRSTAGVKIPGLNVWLLIAVVATVWAVLLSVAVRVIAIARCGADGEASQAPLSRRADAQMGPIWDR
jgi:hypothetical protein